jgi:transposase
MARKTRRTQRLKVVNPDCAGIDIGKDRHFVAVDPERTDDPVRSFGAFTRDLEAMTAWLASCGVTKVAMESTSVYWIPVYETLERAGFEVMLVPPRMTKQIGGRKSDVLDCQWIWQLMSYGLLRGAFRPGDAVCPLRSYVRQARRLTEDRARCVQHMQKALTEMNVRLDSVLTDIMGLTGQKILRAIIGGERDAQRLASFRDRRVKASGDTIAASLEGTWREEHLFALEQAMQRYDFLEQQIEDCEAQIAGQIERLTPPDDPAADSPSGDEGPGDGSSGEGWKTLSGTGGKKSADGNRALTMALHEMMGVDLTAIPAIGTGTVLTIASEIGPDFSAFPSAQHFCSWLGVAPGTRISGGKPLPGRAPKVVNPVGQALRMAAMGARRSQTFIGAKHRARLARKDTAVAITATARELACLIYLMVTRGEEYVEKGMDAYEKRRIDRTFANLNRKARTLG